MIIFVFICYLFLGLSRSFLQDLHAVHHLHAIPLKVAKKLSGHASRTAEWVTNVGNEHGQVLVSVLTVKEGSGLIKMADGLMKRYKDASVDPPVLLYVNRDCCSGKTKSLFAEWDKLQIRLDIHHFMRRITTGCSTEAHQPGCRSAFFSGTVTILRAGEPGNRGAWR
ncbi:uncharacterized protein LOC144652956 [Oculina patagonica]